MGGFNTPCYGNISFEPAFKFFPVAVAKKVPPTRYQRIFFDTISLETNNRLRFTLLSLDFDNSRFEIASLQARVIATKEESKGLTHSQSSALEAITTQEKWIVLLGNVVKYACSQLIPCNGSSGYCMSVSPLTRCVSVSSQRQLGVFTLLRRLCHYFSQGSSVPAPEVSQVQAERTIS